jgi:RNA polymerase-associated protein RTF1
VRLNYHSTSLALVKLRKDLSAEAVKPYKVNDKLVNQGFDLKHGKSIRSFNMDKVSNGPFIEVRFFFVYSSCCL